ncbi:CHAT domain-containing protein [Nostoc sp. WHI]|uniref:CHAT domain-containing protein n=1 Tax=Nostoc sp. WHI TaxID=2650611 RepID=UPI0018C6659C|nr:tetratricopeptide repeat protein [Nostoc sp. WHI]MBG1265838.1 tetratricopeptide repeat protein [Nostoc sp. WHI]MBG1271812.1 tetratricopeptide repeat protein [Nostoc sp. WHI]
MLRRISQSLKRFLKRLIESKQTSSLKGARGRNLVEVLPELTNADLEQLFIQLLEGVHQARGRQWALRYLQRIENRIPAERWIDWLVIFGDRLLASPTPNPLLATQMVQLGELGVGRIGDIAHNIGLRLMQNLPTQIQSEENQAQDGTETTPGQEELSRNLGEQLWEYDEPHVIETTPGQELIRNLGEQLWEYDEPDVVETTTDAEILPISPGQELIRSLGEQLWEYEYDVQDVEPITPIPQNTSFEERLTENLEELVLEYERKDTQSTIPENVPLPAEKDSITSLTQLRFDDEEEVTPTKTPANLLFTRQRTELTTSSSEETWDNTLTNLEPNVAYTLDKLWVRLDQSTNLVQQLASNLAVQGNNSPGIIERHGDNPITQAQGWFYKGLSQAKTGDLLGAIASYAQAIELQPQFSEYWFNRGLTLFHLERFDEAIAAYETATQLKPDYYKAWYNRGGTLGELGYFEEAIASFDKAIEIKPDYQEAWSSRGLALLKLGWLPEAISSYDQALHLEPEDQENWYHRGIALAVGEQFAEAIISYDRAIEIDPEYHEVWIDRGVVLFNLGKWSEAIASWDKALSVQADFYLAWYNRGIALDNLGRRTEAIASYQQAIAIKPDFHLAWYNQALALFYLEEFVEAIACYDNALQIKQDYWEAWIGRGTAIGNLVDADALLMSSSITATNPALQQSGYEGKLASYEEGLKHLRTDTHPEGWGRLHLAIANTYYERGKKHPNSRDYWRKAASEYHQALLTLTLEYFPQFHLEVLQSLSKVLMGLGQTTQVQELQQRGTDLLQQLLNEETRSDESKKQLALKFAGFAQLAVDLAVESGDLVEAWEIAEQGKNACLNWLLHGWNDHIYSPYYHAIQQLFNPTTAIIYWHISPVALHTFILKDQAPSPILLFTPMQDTGVIPLGEDAIRLNELPLPEAVQRLIEFENWLEDWHQQYQEYRSRDKESKSQHSWRVDMEQKLLQLYEILNISTIAQELEGITQLILIPHRDLSRLPLHALFHLSSPSQEELPNVESNFTAIYLPSVQVGLSIKTEDIWQWQNQSVLSVEYPESASYPALKFAKLESEIVSQMFGNIQRIQGSQATKNLVENALFDNYNIFHFTGHTINNLGEPKKSELALAGADKVTLEEICQQNLASYNLVTLSACENLSTSNYTISTEYVSLVNGFLSQGVPHVVSTFWSVESSASALVMIEFYRRLQPNKSAVIALAEATLWLKELTAGELTKWYEDLLNNLHPEELRIKAYLATQLYRNSKMASDKNLYSHPYYWAAFTITGKPN